MKKFRYVDPSSLGFFKRARPFILLFVGWNAFGVLIWRYVSQNASEKDPAWETRSEGEKIAIISGISLNTITKKQISLFGSPKKEDSKQES